jgi:DNA repair protein RadC
MNAFIRDSEGGYQPASSAEIIRLAKNILISRLQRSEDIEVTSPDAVKKFLQLSLGGKEREIFGCLFLDTRHRLICFEELFYGTIDGASVHPREVVKAALRLNAAAVLFSHNHPSGVAEPSQADIAITTRLKSALALIDVRVLDHIIVTADDCVSLAQRGHL